MTRDKTDAADRTVTDNLSPLGLSIDMLDADLLRALARLGLDGVQAIWTKRLADDVEQAVRDIGTLRDAVATLTAQRNDLIVALARSQDALAAATRLIEDAR